MVLDEVSMISCEDLYTIHDRITAAIAATIDDPVERRRKCAMPFGGLHMLFVGDLYQLPPVMGVPLYVPCTEESKRNHRMGRELWESVNKFVELTKNWRMRADKSAGTQMLTQCLRSLRVGNASDEHLALLNSRLFVNMEYMRAKLDDRTVWLCSTREREKELNTKAFNWSVSKGKAHLRCIASHSPSSGTTLPSKEDNEILSKMPMNLKKEAHMKDFPPPFIDMAIGSRVRCTRNLATQIGIFNGALGTIVGFGFKSNGPEIAMPPSSRLQDFMDSHNGYEIPVVFVKMDRVDATIDNNPEEGKRKKGIIPFVAESTKDQTVKANGRSFHRIQLPLLLAHASTVHKFQGLTAISDIVMEPAERVFAMGGDYVALSRATDIERIYLSKQVRAKHFTSHSDKRQMVASEYRRLRSLFITGHEEAHAADNNESELNRVGGGTTTTTCTSIAAITACSFEKLTTSKRLKPSSIVKLEK